MTIIYDDLGDADDGIDHLTIRFGFSDDPDIPRALRVACREGVLPLKAADFNRASYFISRGTIRRAREKGMARWRRSLFIGLANNAADPAARFRLPALRTVTMGNDVEI